MKNRFHRPSDHIITTAMCITVAVALSSLFFTVPTVHDAYWYMKDAVDGGYVPGCGSVSDFIKGVWHTVCVHHHSDNSRLCNMLGAILVWLPTYVTAPLSAAAVATSIYLMRRLAGRAGQSLQGTTFILAMYVLAMPWDDYLFTFVFTYNYIWAGALMLMAAYIFIRPGDIGWGWAALLGIVTGAWHEIFSFPLLCGAVSCMAVRRQMADTRRLALCAGLLAGCIWLFLSPSRTAPEGYGSLIHLGHPTLPLLPHAWPAIAYLLLLATCLCCRHSRGTALTPLNFIAAATSVICPMIYLLTTQPRVLTPSVLMATAATPMLLGAIMRRRRHRFTLRHVPAGVCVAIWIFMMIHLGTAFATGMEIHRQEKQIMEAYSKSMHSGGTVFMDVTRPDNAPFLSLGKPFQGLYEYFAHPMLVSAYMGGDLLRVVPSSLQAYRRGDGRRINADIELRDYGGVLVAEWPGDPPPPHLPAILEYTGGKTRYWTVAYPFTGADGLTHIYIQAPAGDLIRARFMNL